MNKKGKVLASSFSRVQLFFQTGGMFLSYLPPPELNILCFVVALAHSSFSFAATESCLLNAHLFNILCASPAVNETPLISSCPEAHLLRHFQREIFFFKPLLVQAVKSCQTTFIP